MSRIHEALRRRAEEHAASNASGEETARAEQFDGQDIDPLLSEPYPVEIEGVRRLRKHTAEPGASRETSGPREATTSTGESSDRSASLFERIDARLAEKVVVDDNMSSVSREQYRKLAAVLHDTQTNNGLQVVMVASAVPGEGKTLTATNVALTLSDSYRRRVLLIDADLRKPALHQVFRVNTTSGLTEGLEAQSEVKLVLRQVSANLALLPAGRPTSDPMAGLTSDRMRRLIDEARQTFDWIIIDTPPLMLLPDAHLLSALVDGTVLVVKANSTPHELVRRTADTIGKNRVIGVVLNQAKGHPHMGYGGYYYGNYYLDQQKGASRA
jgi:capsular exopolysaccharide synthesis family protein